MTAVLLMNGLDDARMELLPAVGLLGGVVFDRPVVDDVISMSSTPLSPPHARIDSMHVSMYAAEVQHRKAKVMLLLRGLSCEQQRE